jgi:DNA repair protein RecO (recombination protein O)
VSRLTTLTGIVLGQKLYGDADALVTVMTREDGKMTLMAKGIRKLTSRKRGNLLPFTLIKFQKTGASLPIMTEVETLAHFQELRTDMKKISVAYFFCEVVSRVMQDGEKNENVYELLLESLSELNQSERLKTIRNDFTVSILEFLGFWPVGQELLKPDAVLEEVMERKLGSIRIGKQMQ